MDHEAGDRPLEDEPLAERGLLVVVATADRSVGVPLGGKRQPVVDGEAEEAGIGREVVPARGGLHDRAAGELQVGRPRRVAGRGIGAARDQQGGAEDQDRMNEAHARASFEDSVRLGHGGGAAIAAPELSLIRIASRCLEAKWDFGMRATRRGRAGFDSHEERPRPGHDGERARMHSRRGLGRRHRSAVPGGRRPGAPRARAADRLRHAGRLLRPCRRPAEPRLHPRDGPDRARRRSARQRDPSRRRPRARRRA